MYFKHGDLLSLDQNMMNQQTFSRLNKSLVKDIYNSLNYSQSYFVQFKLVKKLFGDKFDTSYLTVYIFPTLVEFKE